MSNNLHIEQLIFEYHEGLLNAEQKSVLMDYLHQHPEWQQEFALWAQVRLQDGSVEVPAFQQKLLKPVGSFAGHWVIKLVGGALLTGLLAVAGWWWTASTNQSILPSIPKGKVPAAMISQKALAAENMGQKQKPLVAAIGQTTKPDSIRSQTNKPSEQQPLPIVDTIVAVPALIVTDKDSMSTEIQQKALVADRADSSRTNGKVSAPVLKEKRRRARQKMSLRPTSDIIPANANF